MAEGAEHLEGLAEHVVAAGGRLAWGLAGDQQRKLRHPAAELGDHPFGGRRADARQRRERLGILLVDRSGNLAHRADDGAEGLPHPDAVDLANEIEKLPLDLRQKAHDPGHEVAAAGRALQKLHRVERDGLAEFRLQAAADQFGDEHLVHHRAHGQFDAVARVIDAVERAGDFRDHALCSAVRRGCS